MVRPLYWWEMSDADIWQGVINTVRTLDEDQKDISLMHMDHMRLYGNIDIQGLTGTNYARMKTPHRVRLNACKSVADTMQNKMSKNRVKVTYLTDGGNWDEQQKAKKLEKFTLGQFYETGLYKTGEKVLLDAAVFGNGYAHHCVVNNKIYSERVFPPEIIIDEQEARYGNPRTMYRRKWLPRDYLAYRFPDAKEVIYKRGKAFEVHKRNTTRFDHTVEIVEAWHLPSDENAKDGKRVLCIEGATLEAESYERDYLPFSKVTYSERLLGYLGIGAIELIKGIQVEINELLKKIQYIFYMLDVPKILTEANSNIVSSHLNNEIGSIIEYTGVPPQIMKLGQVSPEIFNHLMWLYQRCFEVSGVSQLSAQAQKPFGLDSGKAMRTFHNIEAERHIVIGREYEDFFLDAAGQYIDLVTDMIDEETDITVKVPDGDVLETVTWKEIALERDKYIKQRFPTSLLTHEPAGRLAQVQELAQIGIFSPNEIRRLLDFPDLHAQDNLDLASDENLRKTFSNILYKGKYRGPETYQDLTKGVEMAQSFLLMGMNQNAPEDRLDDLRLWISEAQNILQDALDSAQMQAQEQAMQGQALARPESPPTSEYLPPMGTIQ